jgi:hypothetical protein
MREKLIKLLKESGVAFPISTANFLVANGVTVQQWIPVTERLPEKDVLVLCVGARGGMFIGSPRWVYKDEKVAFTHVPNSRHGRQTKYWTHLPQPPKEG